MDRFLFADDLAPEQTWLLLDRCAAFGATELTLNCLSLQGHAAPLVDRFEAEMTPYQLAPQLRPHMSAPTRAELVRSADLWRLSNDSIAVLRRYFSLGLFMYPTSEWDEGCLEDPTFYRDGQIAFGIISHEREGVLTLTPSQHAEVAALGIATRDRPEWL